MYKINLSIKTVDYREATDKIAWSDDKYTHYIVNHDNGRIEYRIDIDLYDYLDNFNKDKKEYEAACAEFLQNEYFIIHNQKTIIDFKMKYYKIFKNELFREINLIYNFMYGMVCLKSKKPIDI